MTSTSTRNPPSTLAEVDPEIRSHLSDDVKLSWPQMSRSDRGSVLASACNLRDRKQSPREFGTSLVMPDIDETKKVARVVPSTSMAMGIDLFSDVVPSIPMDDQGCVAARCNEPRLLTGVRLVTSETLRIDVVENQCGKRACPACGPRWRRAWKADIELAFDGYSALDVVTIRGCINWRAVSGRLERREEARLKRGDLDSIIYCRIPAPSGEVVVTNGRLGDDIVDRMPKWAAMEEIDHALAEVAEWVVGGKGSPRVSMSRSVPRPNHKRFANARGPLGEKFGSARMSMADAEREFRRVAGVEIEHNEFGRMFLTGPNATIIAALARVGIVSKVALELERKRDAENKKARRLAKRDDGEDLGDIDPDVAGDGLENELEKVSA